MTRRMTAAGMACAMVLAAAQVQVSAQAKPAPAKAAPAAKAQAAKAAPARAARAKADPTVTLTGCLEADGRKYMLTDLEGAESPKGRSWKTGFVTKKSKDVEVIASSGVKLGDHLGRKVRIAGVRNGETPLQARSIKQVAASCS